MLGVKGEILGEADQAVDGGRQRQDQGQLDDDPAAPGGPFGRPALADEAGQHEAGGAHRRGGHPRPGEVTKRPGENDQRRDQQRQGRPAGRPVAQGEQQDDEARQGGQRHQPGEAPSLQLHHQGVVHAIAADQARQQSGQGGDRHGDEQAPARSVGPQGRRGADRQLGGEAGGIGFQP